VVESVSKESQQNSVNAEAASPATPDDTLAGQLRRTSELISAQRLHEAESVLVEARQISGNDLRLLRLLALVRFKLGQLPEARSVYRDAAVLAPEDAAIRLNLGLIALKLEDYPEAARELETAVRLQPDDRRAWSYLGYAYAKNGSPAQAATAFRRAGQHELAAEMERAAAPASHPGQDAVVEGELSRDLVAPAASTDAASSMATPRPLLRRDDTPIPSLLADERPDAGNRVTTLASFTTSRLLSVAPAGERGAAIEYLGRGVMRFAAGAETHVRRSALLVAIGDAGVAPGRRRARGQLSNQGLSAGGDPLLRIDGKADLLIASPDQERSLVGLSLEHDVFYVEASRVVAWGDEIVWEAGNVPGNGTPLLQFRGSGRIVVLAGKDELVALPIAEGDRMAMPRVRLAGWLGRVVVQAVAGQAPEDADHVTCEGEGVLLISKHGELP
jgi:tetratricopeptide (TPR) repeat protein